MEASRLMGEGDSQTLGQQDPCEMSMSITRMRNTRITPKGFSPEKGFEWSWPAHRDPHLGHIPGLSTLSIILWQTLQTIMANLVSPYRRCVRRSS